MRITNGMLEQAVTRHLGQSLDRLARAQELVATGIRVAKTSDDPVGAAQIMRINHGLRVIDQYRRNTAAARVRLTTQESVLDQTTTLVTRARELGLDQAGSTATTSTRQITAAEVDRLLEQVFHLGNSRVGNEYVFGGGETAAPPFQGGIYQGDLNARDVEIRDGITVTVNLTGQQLLVDSNVITALTNLRDGLLNDDTTAITTAVTELDTAFDDVQRLLTDTGANVGQLDLAAETNDDADLDLTTHRSELRDVRFEEATTAFVTAQTTLEAARLAASRLLNTTLADFLR